MRCVSERWQPHRSYKESDGAPRLRDVLQVTLNEFVREVKVAIRVPAVALLCDGEAHDLGLQVAHALQGGSLVCKSK